MISAGGSERETHNRPFELEEASRTKPGFNSEGLTQQTLPPQCLGYAPHPSMGKEIPKGFQFQGIAGQASTPSQHGYGRRNPHGRATVSVGAAMSSRRRMVNVIATIFDGRSDAYARWIVIASDLCQGRA
jgi:hypothetical protein